MDPMNHASWLDMWDRGLVVPTTAAMQWKGRSLNQPPSNQQKLSKKANMKVNVLFILC